MAGIYRIEFTSDCPDCGRRLRLNRRKRDGGEFVGCTGFPNCRFAEDLEGQGILGRLHSLEEQVRALARRDPMSLSAVSSKFRDMIAWCHPDKHPTGMISAHEVTVRLNQIRKELSA